jgi:hypothetical protein
MNAYSKDLRRKIAEAVERGMPKAEAARAFGLGRLLRRALRGDVP